MTPLERTNSNIPVDSLSATEARCEIEFVSEELAAEDQNLMTAAEIVISRGRGGMQPCGKFPFIR